METSITTNTESAKSFKLVEGSNYKIIDSFKCEYIVDFQQFQRIAKALFKDNAEMVTINEDIVGTKFIYKITPTTEKTSAEKQIIRKQRERIDELRERGMEILRLVEETKRGLSWKQLFERKQKEQEFWNQNIALHEEMTNIRNELQKLGSELY